MDKLITHKSYKSFIDIEPVVFKNMKDLMHSMFDEDQRKEKEIKDIIKSTKKLDIFSVYVMKDEKILIYVNPKKANLENLIFELTDSFINWFYCRSVDGALGMSEEDYYECCMNNDIFGIANINASIYAVDLIPTIFNNI